MKIIALVVTYNRENLLKECLEALLKQSYSLEKIVIVNNCSTDGTKDYLDYIKLNDEKEKFLIINLEKNVGGAGGFYEGIKASSVIDYDFIWIMDDDTIANEECLKKLVSKTNVDEKIGFLCSNVLWKDNSVCIMNIPHTYKLWNERLDAGLIRLKSTSFVSVLIKKSVIVEVGLPIKEFFIWGDDAEYTSRISNKYKGYMVSDSIVYHYMNENKDVNIIYDDNNRIARYFYEYRNKLFIKRKEGLKGILSYFKYLLTSINGVILKSKNNKYKRIKYILKGFVSGVKFNPKIEYLEGE